jgi:hypothetical protein
MANQSQSTCVEQRSLVRSSSNWRCGSRRLQKERWCKVCAYSPARVRKARDGGLAVAEDTLGSGRVQPKGSRRQHHSDLVRGGFQTVQGSVKSSTESGAAGLTAKRLDPLGMAMLAIPNQSVDVSICDAGVGALVVRTGKALCVDPLGCSPSAFHLAPGAYRRRRRGRTHTRREGAGKATGGAIAGGAWRCRRRWTGMCLAAVTNWAGQ